MTGLLRAELRHLVRSPLLWLAVSLAGAVSALELVYRWPVVPGDELVVYQSSFLVCAGASMSGALLGLRDRRGEVGELLEVTPTPAWVWWLARLLAGGAAAIVAVAVLQMAGLGAAVLRGGRGLPDLRLLADAVLAVTLCAWGGLALGWATGSRVAAALVAPAAVAAAFTYSFTQSGGLARLAPILVGEQRSVVLGFVPDPFWGHLAYLAGLTALTGVGVVVAARRGREPRLVTRALGAIGALAVVVAGVAGTWLTALPGVLVATGPEPSAWEPVPPVVLETSSEDAELGDPAPVATSPPPTFIDMVYRVEGVLSSIRSVAYTDGVGTALYAGGEIEPFAYPQDGRATACARSEDLEVCVYPAFGERRARDVLEDLEPLAALLDGLPGVPGRVRMVPSTLTPCAEGEVQIVEDDALQFGPGQYHWVYAECAVGAEAPGPDPYQDEAAIVRSVLADWAVGVVDPAWREASLMVPIESESSFAAEGITPEEQERIYAGYVTHARALRALATLPPEQVIAELEPLWERVRAGTLPLEDLPGGPG